jgi:hypothetical protein
MEIIVCILTTLFFAVLEILDLKSRASRASRPGSCGGEFVVLPFYTDNGAAEEVMAHARRRGVRDRLS